MLLFMSLILYICPLLNLQNKKLKDSLHKTYSPFKYSHQYKKNSELNKFILKTYGIQNKEKRKRKIWQCDIDISKQKWSLLIHFLHH